jgi:hypothetical protein
MIKKISVNGSYKNEIAHLKRLWQYSISILDMNQESIFKEVEKTFPSHLEFDQAKEIIISNIIVESKEISERQNSFKVEDEIKEQERFY